ncbi:MAG TPA: hypothetical protein PK526_01505 [bacterium]|nr:hypothetical protein [bacterium]
MPKKIKVRQPHIEEAEPVETEFVEKPLPEEKTISRADFSADTDDELLEIYEDENGRIIDVKKINRGRGRSKFGAFFRALLITLVVGALAYGAYFYFFNYRPKNSNLLELSVNAPAQVQTGEELLYEVNYKNNSQSNLEGVKIEITYPDNFVFTESLPSPSQNQNSWDIGSLGANQTGSLKIKGKMLAVAGSDNLLLASGTYRWQSFSLEFKTETSAVVSVKDLGFKVEAISASTALLNEESRINLTFSNYQILPESLDLVVKLPPNIELLSVNPVAANNMTTLQVEKLSDNSWRLKGFDKNNANQDLDIKYRAKEKVDNQEPINLRLEALANGKNYLVWEQALSVEVLNSTLSLVLNLNDQPGDQAVNFGSTLNYSLNFVNRGQSSLKDVVIMAVVEGDMVDWNSLKDKYKGQKRNGSIIWTKDEVPELKELLPDKEGRIDFSVNVANFQESDLGKDFQIRSYAQFNVGGGEIKEGNTDNRSNVVVSKINSDLRFAEQIRYFDEDNVPVGSGPLPPKVGEKTTFKVLWRLDNNLHELNNLKVEYPLPAYINFEGREETGLGSVYYDNNSRRVVWQIDKWENNKYQQTASFYISLTPRNEDQNKIMVISNGAAVSALDVDTQENINLKSQAKTTRLEDDDIASLNNDGRVE